MVLTDIAAVRQDTSRHEPSPSFFGGSRVWDSTDQPSANRSSPASQIAALYQATSGASSTSQADWQLTMTTVSAKGHIIENGSTLHLADPISPIESPIARADNGAESTGRLTVSLVIPVRNEARNVGWVLEQSRTTSTKSSLSMVIRPM